MSGHTISFTVHGTTEMRVHADSRPNLPEGAVLHITCGLSTLCMCMRAEDMRSMAHVLTLAADEAYMRGQRVEVTA